DVASPAWRAVVARYDGESELAQIEERFIFASGTESQMRGAFRRAAESCGKMIKCANGGAKQHSCFGHPKRLVSGGAESLCYPLSMDTNRGSSPPKPAAE